jgi:hypothetical protein
MNLDWGLIGKGLIALVTVLTFAAGIFLFMLKRLYGSVDKLFELDAKTKDRTDRVIERVRILELHLVSKEGGALMEKLTK